VNWDAVQGWVTGYSLVRKAAEAVFRAASRHHLARFDCLAPARCQTRILLGLIHKAQATRFGRDHDFRRIRTVADFRRLVPLCTRADLWRQYAQPVPPHLNGAKTSQADKEGNGQDHSVSPCLPFSWSCLHAAHRHALRTALALVVHSRPRSRLLTGDLLFVGEDGPSSATERGNLSERLPALVRPYARLDAETPAERWAYRPVSCLGGSVERLLSLLEMVKQVRGKSCLRDIWPDLSAILYTRRSAAAPVERLRAEAEDVQLLEMAARADGPIAVEDPRYGLLRLLHDHGVYFEFVPADQCDERGCPRYGIDEIEVGVPYELVLTSPAGLWACRIGRTVCLEGREPPVLRFLEGQRPSLAGYRTEDGSAAVFPRPRADGVTLPKPASHRQIGDSPAVRPESSFHSPWSLFADRG
jgi:hypothetical protein